MSAQTYRFAWDVDGCWWQGEIPECPNCGNALTGYKANEVPLEGTWREEWRVECSDCGASFPIDDNGETVTIPSVELAQGPAGERR